MATPRTYLAAAEAAPSPRQRDRKPAEMLAAVSALAVSLLLPAHKQAAGIPPPRPAAVSVPPIAFPQPHAIRNQQNQVESGNWSGYALPAYATGTEYTSVSGSWVVPRVRPAPRQEYSYSATWIGIGGFCLNARCSRVDDSLIQIGTEQDTTPKGPVYYAWLETLPDRMQFIYGLTVHPGDTIRANLYQPQLAMASLLAARLTGITEQNPVSQTWEAALVDETTGQSWSQQIVYNSSRASAEWIEEAPYDADAKRVLPMADYSQMAFMDGTANNALLNAGGYEAVYMHDRAGQSSVPSPLNDTGNGFDVCWGRRACPPPAS